MITKGFRAENASKIQKKYSKFLVGTHEFVNASKKSLNNGKGGVPLGYSAEERTVIIDDSDTHTLVYGATGSLKTRAIVMPTIKILGYAEESMIINDSKGELYEKLAGGLKKRGYNIISINLRNPNVGNSWNPLYIPFQFYLMGDIDKAAEFSNDIATNLTVNNSSSDDPFWDNSACDLLFSLIMLLFKFCKDEGKDTSYVNIANLLELRRKIFSQTVEARNTLLWKYASEDELIAARMSGTVFAPKDTKNSILSVFDQHLSTFTIQSALLDMLANNDIDFEQVGKTKTAIFMITPDEKTSYHKLVSLFVKQSYEYFIYLASLEKNKMFSKRIWYILDEFSSLPAIADMPSMISAARSRNIRFLLVVQSKSSLKKKYAEEAETIVSNCSNIIFFTSRELELLRELCELCGTKTANEPNISVYDLQHLSKEKREALVLCGRMDPAIVTMLDIDSFDRKQDEKMEFIAGKRVQRNKIVFEESHILKKNVAESSMNSYMNPFLESKVQNNEMDSIMKKIDEKVEKMELKEILDRGGENAEQ